MQTQLCATLILSWGVSSRMFCICRKSCNVVSVVKLAACGKPQIFRSQAESTLQSLEHIVFLQVESVHLTSQCRGRRGWLKEGWTKSFFLCLWMQACMYSDNCLYLRPQACTYVFIFPYGTAPSHSLFIGTLWKLHVLRIIAGSTVLLPAAIGCKCCYLCRSLKCSLSLHLSLSLSHTHTDRQTHTHTHRVITGATVLPFQLLWSCKSCHFVCSQGLWREPGTSSRTKATKGRNESLTPPSQVTNFELIFILLFSVAHDAEVTWETMPW